MKLQEQGKTEQARKDLGKFALSIETLNLYCFIGHLLLLFFFCFKLNADRLSLIRQQRAEAAKKREEEKAGMFLNSTPICLAFVLLEYYVC